MVDVNDVGDLQPEFGFLYRKNKQMKQQKCCVGTLNANDVLLRRTNKKATIKRSYAPHNRSDITEASGNETASRFDA